MLAQVPKRLIHTYKRVHHNLTEKKCTRCARVLPIEQFYERKNRENGRSECKECHTWNVLRARRKAKKEVDCGVDALHDVQ